MRGAAGVYLLGGPGSGADDLISAVGGIDVGTEIGLERPFTQMTSEAMISASPVVIFVLYVVLESVSCIELMLQLPGITYQPDDVGRRCTTDKLTTTQRCGWR